MSAEDNLRLFEEFVTAQNEHDLEHVLKLFSPESTLAVYGVMTFSGMEEITDFYKNLFHGRPDYKCTVIDVIADEQRIYADTTFAATYLRETVRRDGVVVPASGRSYKINGVWRLQIADRKIAQGFIAMNEADRMRQVGLL